MRRLSASETVSQERIFGIAFFNVFVEKKAVGFVGAGAAKNTAGLELGQSLLVSSASLTRILWELATRETFSIQDIARRCSFLQARFV